jgi:hypothetical protein
MNPLLGLGAEALRDQAAAMRESSSAARGLAAGINAIPAKKTTTVTVKVDMTELAKIGEYQRQQNVKCFAAGTLIAMRGWATRQIQDVKAGDMVMAFDHSRGANVDSLVVNTSRHMADTVLIEFATGAAVVCTPEHPFYVPARGDYVPASQLHPNDVLLSLTGEPILVDNVMPWHECDVYNFEVLTFHNYYAAGVLVHNASKLMTAEDFAAVNPRAVVHVAQGGRADTVRPVAPQAAGASSVYYNLTINSNAKAEDVRADFDLMRLMGRR